MRQLIAGLALLLAACGDDGASLRISDASYRAPLLEGRPGVAYFSVMSTQDDRITGVSSPDAERVEMHATVTSGGSASMNRVDSVELPAGEAVTFGPGGLHMMVFGPKPAAAGATFRIQIALQSGRNETVSFDLR